MDELELEMTINIQKLDYEFLNKPIIVGGLAMEYYGLRKHGDDIDQTETTASHAIFMAVVRRVCRSCFNSRGHLRQTG